jgi:malonate decarboxylase alpha subunit
LRARGIVAYPEDLGIARAEARHSLLAAHSIDELIEWSGGLYQPPDQVRRR